MDFLKRNKVFIIVVLATLVLLIGGIYLFSRGSGNSTTLSSTVSSSLLIPQNDYETSGIVNGNYLLATPSASVTLVEFGDYECPACGEYHPMVKQLLTDFAGKVIFVFRNFPLSQHLNAPISAYAAEAAGLQGKFWQMHDKLYETQNDWSGSTDARSIFIGYAKDLGLDVTKFTADIDSSAVKNKVQSDMNDGNTIGINETPTFFLNGSELNLTGSSNELETDVQKVLNGK
ncbi:MAG: thioredoxin domain-containing protein [Candidatus Microgenomates bacterium]|jgi:protein-disulfide isomerase